MIEDRYIYLAVLVALLAVMAFFAAFVPPDDGFPPTGGALI